MYFVHPLIKFNIKNIISLKLCFLKRKKEDKVEEKLNFLFPKKKFYFTDMGRNAFRLIIETFHLQNSKMLAPAYLCDIFYPIFKQYNITPIFIDIDKKTFNLNPETLKNIPFSVLKQVKSILIVHTYGLPVNIEKTKEILNQLFYQPSNKPFIIEDCAHSFGSKIGETLTGNFGDAAFFSLYKIFPTLRGGLTILPHKIPRPLFKTSFTLRDFISFLNSFSFFAFLFKKYANKIAPNYLKKEKFAVPSALNRISFNIFAYYLKNFEKKLANRRKLAIYFIGQLKKLGFETPDCYDNPINQTTVTFTYLSVLCPKNIERDKFIIKLRKKGVFALRIWKNPIISNPEVQREYKIETSRFPNTSEVSKRIINFPLQNFYNQKDIDKMVKKIREILKIELSQ
jgi:dTDP-4-amino-4,6-dideoxygalactose transaminase